MATSRLVPRTATFITINIRRLGPILGPIKDAQRVLALSLLLFSSGATALVDKECPTPSPLQENDVLIGWYGGARTTYQIKGHSAGIHTTLGRFRPLAVIRDKRIEETDGGTIHRGQRFWPVTDKSKSVVLASVGSVLDHMNEDHCVYFATTRDLKHPRWTLFGSRPLHDLFRKPTTADLAIFHRENITCVYQEEKAPCIRPTLLAVSDVDKNGAPEYWVAMPYVWDTGVSVYEYKDTLVPILHACPGCAD